MFALINTNLKAQKESLELLEPLLQAEHMMLLSGDIERVLELEQSVHQLLVIAYTKRIQLQELLAGRTVLECAAEQPEERATALKRNLATIEKTELHCSALASRNARLSLLLAQSPARLASMVEAVAAPQPETACAGVQ